MFNTHYTKQLKIFTDGSIDFHDTIALLDTTTKTWMNVSVSVNSGQVWMGAAGNKCHSC